MNRCWRMIMLFFALPIGLSAQLSVMTFNIRYDNPNDGENLWSERRGEVVDMIEHYAPDAFGIQEGLYTQVQFLDSVLSDYSYLGVGRDDGQQAGEYTALFYNHDRLKPVSSMTYWLSETPDQVSVGWDASMERITTYAGLYDRDSELTYHVFNAHFDHIGPVAREHSALLINQLIRDRDLLGERVIVMGDFNCLPAEAPIIAFEQLLQDSYQVSQQKPYGPTGTWCSFDITTPATRRIDYIMVRNVEVLSYRNIDDRRSDHLNLSDHLPVMIDIN